MATTSTRAIAVLGAALAIALHAEAADSLGTRVQRAKLVEGTPEGKAYQEILWKQVGDATAKAMQQCFPSDTKEGLEPFTLVGNILPSCLLSRVEVRPATPGATCFAKGFAGISFPRPPNSFGAEGIPIEMDIKLTP